MEESNVPAKAPRKRIHINEALGCLTFVLVAQTISYPWLLRNGFAANLSHIIASFNPYLSDKFISLADNPEKYSATHTLSIIFAPVFLLIFFYNHQKSQPTPIGKQIISLIFLAAIFLTPTLIEPTEGKRLNRIIFNDGVVGIIFGMSTSILIAAIIFGIFSVSIELYLNQGEKR